MRSTLGRPFLNVAKETMFDFGQLGGHLVDDWALESRLVYPTVTTHQVGQIERGYLDQEYLKSACALDHCCPITKLYSPNLAFHKYSLFQYMITMVNFQPLKASIPVDFPLECKYLKGRSLLYKTICRFSRESVKK